LKNADRNFYKKHTENKPIKIGFKINISKFWMSLGLELGLGLGLELGLELGLKSGIDI
jgi:hypothetical protein